MLAGAEFVSRALKKRAARDAQFAQDERAVSQMSREALRDPEAFAVDGEDRAFIVLGQAISTAKREIEDAEDADDYGEEAPDATLPRTCALLERCLAADEHCYDARLLMTLARARTDDDAISQLIGMEDEARAWCAERSGQLDGAVGDAWEGVFMRPYLRIEAKIIDLLISSTRYRAALARCERLLKASPADGQGIRHTAALLYARLEDEAGLDALDALFGRQGSTWMHIARAVLLYKLGRADAARRAVGGLATLCPGAAYYLANPDYVEPYVPDRPPFTPGSAKESLLASYEADFLVMDTPNFVAWASQVQAFARAEEGYGRSHGEEL